MILCNLLNLQVLCTLQRRRLHQSVDAKTLGKFIMQGVAVMISVVIIDDDLIWTDNLSLQNGYNPIIYMLLPLWIRRRYEKYLEIC